MKNVKRIFSAKSKKQPDRPSTQLKLDKPWLDLQYQDKKKALIKKPNELENEMKDPPGRIDENILDRIQGSMIGMALGDALGAHVEFRPRQYMLANRVTDLEGGGTWGLQKGQFTDDTSMALCLANSLVTQCDFNPYDQLVRYKWWHKNGYMSSTGKCFDIGAATSQSINEFEHRQKRFAKENHIRLEEMDYLSDPQLLANFDVYCSADGVAGNGALMRLAPVPLFFFRFPKYAVEFSGQSGEITHGDVKANDACRYYAALIVAVLHGDTKDQILNPNFYSKRRALFGERELCPEILEIAEGSYQREGGYNDGIRGKGYIVNALEAALWAFWSDEDSFEIGALAAVNLGDDTDTTAAIYGQLAGAYYGYRNLPQKWLKHVYARKFMINLSRWIVYEGERWQPSEVSTPTIPKLTTQPQPGTKISGQKTSSDTNFLQTETTDFASNSYQHHEAKTISESNQRPTPLRGANSLSSTDEPAQHLSSNMNQRSSSDDEIKSHPSIQPQPSSEITKKSKQKSSSNANSLQTKVTISAPNKYQSQGTVTAQNNQRRSLLQPTTSLSSTDESTSQRMPNRNQGVANNSTANSYGSFHLQSSGMNTKAAGQNSNVNYARDRQAPVPQPGPTQHYMTASKDNRTSSSSNNNYAGSNTKKPKSSPLTANKSQAQYDPTDVNSSLPLLPQPDNRTTRPKTDQPKGKNANQYDLNSRQRKLK